ncbi:MAG: sulfotransferase [Bacteroidia bacterium]|nr:sulfotransferase [Bacteroidia bacterium]
MDFSKVKYNFILGHGRGGTTLLLYILNSHPNIYGIPEIKNILLLKNSSDSKKNKEIALKYLKRLERRTFLNNFPDTYWAKKIDEDLFNSAFDENLDKREMFIRMALSINKVYDAPKRDKSIITHIIHKVPYYTFCAKKLLEIFPETKFIINIRDPRAQSYSYIKRAPSGRFLYARMRHEGKAVMWNFYANETLKLLQEYPDKCYLFQYEKFVENPTHTIQEILKFLGLTYNEKIWDYHMRVKEFIEETKFYLTENKLKKYIALSKPVSSEFKEDWKKMSPKDIQIIESICKNNMIQLNYTLMYPNIQQMNILSKLRKKIFHLWYWLVFKSPLATKIHNIYQLYFF